VTFSDVLLLLALLVAAAFLGAALWLFHRWVRVKEQEHASMEDPIDEDVDPIAVARDAVQRDKQEWTAEQRRAGRTPEQIQAALDQREPIVWG
jgi:uncharacterized protein HemX